MEGKRKTMQKILPYQAKMTDRHLIFHIGFGMGDIR